MARQSKKKTDDALKPLSPAVMKKALSEQFMRLHHLAGLRGVSDDVLYSRIELLTPTEGKATLYERIQIHGLKFYDNETMIKVSATQLARITGTPLWKKNLLHEYERDDNQNGIVATWCKFIYPRADESVEKVLETKHQNDLDKLPANTDEALTGEQIPADDDLDNADDPDYGVPTEA